MVCPGLVFFRLCLLGLRSTISCLLRQNFMKVLPFISVGCMVTVGVGPRLGARVLCSSAPLFRC